jgi:hypothetical protein
MAAPSRRELSSPRDKVSIDSVNFPFQNSSNTRKFCQMNIIGDRTIAAIADAILKIQHDICGYRGRVKLTVATERR